MIDEIIAEIKKFPADKVAWAIESVISENILPFLLSKMLLKEEYELLKDAIKGGINLACLNNFWNAHQQINEKHVSAIFLTIFHKREYELLDLLNQSGIDLSIMFQHNIFSKIIIDMIEKNEIKAIEFLYKHNYDLTDVIFEDHTPVSLAVFLGKTEIVNTFHQLGIDLHQRSEPKTATSILPTR